MRLDALTAVFILGVALAGCSTLVVPLCPKLLDPVGAVDGVNRYTLEQTRRQGVIVEPLSPFVARLRGSYFGVESVKADYRFLVCAFDPNVVIPDEATFMRCVNHAPSWVDHLNSREPEELMLTELSYSGTCVP